MFAGQKERSKKVLTVSCRPHLAGAATQRHTRYLQRAISEDAEFGRNDDHWWCFIWRYRRPALGEALESTRGVADRKHSKPLRATALCARSPPASSFRSVDSCPATPVVHSARDVETCESLVVASQRARSPVLRIESDRF